MFAGTIRCLLFPSLLFPFWSSLMHPSVINYQEPRNRIKLDLLNTLVHGTSENSWRFTPLNGCGQPLHKRPVGEITCRKGGRDGQNEITPNNMLRRGMHKQLCDPQWQSTSRWNQKPSCNYSQRITLSKSIIGKTQTGVRENEAQSDRTHAPMLQSPESFVTTNPPTPQY